MKKPISSVILDCSNQHHSQAKTLVLKGFFCNLAFYLELLHIYEAENCRISVEIESAIAYSSRDGTVSPSANGFPKHTNFMTWLRSQWCPKVTNLPPRCTPDEPKSDQEVPPGTTKGTQARYISSKAHPWGANECFVGRS